MAGPAITTAKRGRDVHALKNVVKAAMPRGVREAVHALATVNARLPGYQ